MAKHQERLNPKWSFRIQIDFLFRLNPDPQACCGAATWVPRFWGFCRHWRRRGVCCHCSTPRQRSPAGSKQYYISIGTSYQRVWELKRNFRPSRGSSKVCLHWYAPSKMKKEKKNSKEMHTIENKTDCSAQTVTRIGLLEEIPRSGVQIPCLS